MPNRSGITGHKIVHAYEDGSSTDFEVEMTDAGDGVYLKSGNDDWMHLLPASWPAIRDAINDLMDHLPAKEEEPGS